MSGFVVDASVAIKWYLPEPWSEHAAHLQHMGTSFHAPDLLYAEVGNALWKRVKRTELTRQEAAGILEALVSMPMEVHPARLLATAAQQIACATALTVYDSLYAATALLAQMPLVTADRRLFEVARRTPPLRNMVVWIENAPR